MTLPPPVAPCVLLVEDNQDSADMLARRLRRHGFEVRVATDGRSAVDAVRADHPDIVLMDMSLPILDGWAATTELKADPATRKIPVIALTAHTMSDDEQRARGAGCDDFHGKPIEFPRLLEQIRRALERP